MNSSVLMRLFLVRLFFLFALLVGARAQAQVSGRMCIDVPLAPLVEEIQRQVALPITKKGAQDGAWWEVEVFPNGAPSVFAAGSSIEVHLPVAYRAAIGRWPFWQGGGGDGAPVPLLVGATINFSIANGKLGYSVTAVAKPIGRCVMWFAFSKADRTDLITDRARVVLDGSLGAVTSRLDRLANVTLGRTNLPVGDKVYSLNSFRAGPPRGFGDRLRIPIEFATEVPVNDNTSDPTLVWDPAIAPCQ